MAEIKRTYDWKPDRYDPRDRRFAVPDRLRASELPPSVDLRPECPPVYDQGSLGSCTGNALAGLHQFVRTKTHPGQPGWVPSRLFIYWGERAIEGTVGRDAGGSIQDGMSILAKKGVPPETSWPYVIANFTTKPPSPVWGEAYHHKISSYERLDDNQLVDPRVCLASGFPFAFGFTVYESFESQYVASTGIMPMPRPFEKVLGGHAVLAVGYINSQQAFIVRNSWGSSWGQDGYFMMPYQYMINPKLTADFWTTSSAS